MRTEYPAGGSIHLAFPTAILRRVFTDSAETNARLTEIILEREKSDPGVGRSNVGGWHSGDDVFDWPYPEIATFRGYVSEAISEITNFALAEAAGGPRNVEMGGAAWVNLCRDGGYNKIHNHPDCTWSGVYYVTVGQRDPDAPEGSGMIEFLDPRMGATAIGLSGPEALPKIRIDPEPGLIMIFPSWLYHYVNPYRGTGPRISIAFNIKLEIS